MNSNVNLIPRFKAESTRRLHNLLSKDWVKGSLEVELDELRILLGVEGKYSRWKDFQKRIVKSITEINKLSDFTVSYERIKHGRNVVKLIFSILPKS